VISPLLARRILGSVDRRESSEKLRRSPDIDRLAEVARWLTLVGEQVPPCVRELIHRAEAGWQPRTCHELEGEEPFEL
jgi:hypothetical protein